MFRSDLVVVTSRSLHDVVVRRRGTTKKAEPVSENPEMDDFLEDSDDLE